MLLRLRKVAFAGLLVLSVYGVGCKGVDQTFRNDFLGSLKESRQISVTNIGTALLVVPTAERPNPPRCIVSTDQKHLAVLFVDGNDLEKSKLRLFSVVHGLQLAEISAVRSNGLSLVPFDAQWAPMSSDLLVFMKFSDSDYGVWVSFSLKSGDFSVEGKRQMSEVLRYDKSYRPDYMYSGKAVWAPVWDINGVRHASADHALRAGVERLWIPPTFSGEARTRLAINGCRYEVLIELGIGRSAILGKPYALPAARAYVVSDGSVTTRMEVASAYTPENALLFYEGGDLLLVGGGDDEMNGYRTWKVRFPQSWLTQFLVVDGEPQSSILVTQSRSTCTVFLLKISSGMR